MTSVSKKRKLFPDDLLYSEGRFHPPYRGFVHIAAQSYLIYHVTRYWNELAPQTRTFLLTVIACFTISALYHTIPWPPNGELIMQYLDHSTIVVLTFISHCPFLPPMMKIATGAATALSLYLVAVEGNGKIWCKMLPAIVAAPYMLVTLRGPVRRHYIGALIFAAMAAYGFMVCEPHHDVIHLLSLGIVYHIYQMHQLSCCRDSSSREDRRPTPHSPSFSPSQSSFDEWSDRTFEGGTW